MSNGTIDSSSGEVAEPKRRSWVANFVLRLVREKPLGTVGAVITLILIFTGVFAHLIAPYGMNETFTEHFLKAPSSQFWLGTDNLGRDLLSRIIYGARVSVITGVVAASISIVISLLIGIPSGYLGGKFDLVMQRFVDAVMSLPGLVILMVIISMIGPGMWSVIITLGGLWGIIGSRIIRGAVIGIKENMYVAAAVAIGCPTRQMFTRHILPNIMAPVIVEFSINVPAIIMTEAGLSFLGFGIPPPTPSWGGMLGIQGRSFMFMAPWMVIWPGLALAIVVYGVNVFGDAVRDILDPRLRGGIGRYGVQKTKHIKNKK